MDGTGSDGRRQDSFRRSSRGFASIGDSYSAGIGTRIEGKEDPCRLGLGGYPALLYADLVDEAAATTAFQWLSCTGATTDDVVGSAAGGGGGQVDGLNTSAAAALDFVTLSIGGNDLGFFDVINACVFRFYGFYSGTCAEALERAEALVAGPDGTDAEAGRDVFADRLLVILLQLLERLRWERHPRLRIVVTGYARFFNAETPTCDVCTMSVWGGGGHQAVGLGLGRVPHTSPDLDSTLLTRTLRRRMNALVAGANAKLQAVLAVVNARFPADAPRVLFVDYDAAFAGHRFCEPGVVEPDYGRNDTWFFLVGGADSDGTGTEALLDAGSPLVDPDRCLSPALDRGDWGELALCHMARTRQTQPALEVADGVLSPQNSMWYVPTYYGKTFHPRSAGHRAIRDAVYRVWEEHGV